MKKILTLIILFSLCGCQTLEQGRQNMKHFAGSAWKAVKSIHLPKPSSKPVAQNFQGGYLAGGVESIRPLVTEQNKNPEYQMHQPAAGVDAASKSDLKQIVKELQLKLKEESDTKKKVQEEFSKSKLLFEKQIFKFYNMVETEKQKNQTLKSSLIKAEFKALKSEQKMNEMKTDILAKMNLFYSGFPFFYEVKKGDNLWKIAAKHQIYGNGYKWIEIFYANKTKLENKDLIYPGVTLKIPRYYESLMSNLTGADVESKEFEQSEK
jgi:hypothetical protein